MDGTEIESYNEVTAKLLEMKENITKSVLTVADGVVDEETQTIIIDTMGDMTKGGDKFSNETIIQIANTISTIVKKQIGTSPSKRRRRRRDAHDNEGTKDGKDVENVSIVLKFPESFFIVNCFIVGYLDAEIGIAYTM